MGDLQIAPTRHTQVVVIGGGISGVWVALRLAYAGVDTLLINYCGTDRGGVLGSSQRSVGAINTSPLEQRNFREFIDELGLGQTHPSVTDLILSYLPRGLAELQKFGEFKSIKLGVALANGNAHLLLRNLLQYFQDCGGQVLDAWVTRIVADRTACYGVQYQHGNAIGKVLASAIVVASGGYAGLFDGSVKTNNYGTVLGRFLQAGGIATNLEFIFKHGYGQPDIGALTPTEELPGAEVYDETNNHVEWLERELYEGRGTTNHLEAFKHWRNNNDKKFFIDLKYCELYAKVQAINATYCGQMGTANPNSIKEALGALTEICPAAERRALEDVLLGWIRNRERIDFERFCMLKPFFSTVASGEVFRVRQIAYFSMGGVAHLNCTTNLANVFVTGEAMHDFGAHRVGGLPWGLYLAAGQFICDRIVGQLRIKELRGAGDFELVHTNSNFHAATLQEIRIGLYRYQERDLNTAEASKFISWLRDKRRTLISGFGSLDDAVAWTIIAEGIMQASLCRTESRGCFYRSDYPMPLEQMRSCFSCVHYDSEADVVAARLIHTLELSDILSLGCK
jgi:succinate dehydrogenase/fumarate reductase flavoprotein subunit